VTLNNGAPFPPFPDSYGSSMGMGVPLLGVPGIFLDSVLVVEHNTPLKQSVEKVPSMGFVRFVMGRSL